MSSEEVINDLLGYPGLKIIQRPDMFNFSLDSTILAYFVTINKSAKRIMDLGCGNGYIPIFLTLRTTALIDGVEIQNEAYELALRSVELNKLEKQITLYLADMKEIYKTVGVCQYDIVTCNPPYFEYKESSLTKLSTYQTIARHEIKVNLDEAVHSAYLILKDKGIFAMVHRAERLLDVLTSFRNNGIEPKRLLFIYPKKTSNTALAIFVEGIKSNKHGNLKVLPPLYVYNEDDTYTKEILKIFNYAKE
jgi:tRNA1(Val) A37 N6-methylase TrmN6